MALQEFIRPESFEFWALWYPLAGLPVGRRCGRTTYNKYKERQRRYRAYRSISDENCRNEGIWSGVSGTCGWPLVLAVFGVETFLKGTKSQRERGAKTGADALARLFISPPPKPIRKQRKLAELYKHVDQLEKELGLDEPTA
jgi:hypothetical protein